MAWNSMHTGFDFFVMLGAIAKNPFVIGGHDFNELRRDLGPLGEDFFGDDRAGVFAMLLDQVQQLGAIFRRRNLLQLDDAEVAATDEVAGSVPDIRDAAAHTGGEVSARWTEHNHA